MSAGRLLFFRCDIANNTSVVTSLLQQQKEKAITTSKINSIVIFLGEAKELQFEGA